MFALAFALACVGVSPHDADAAGTIRKNTGNRKTRVPTPYTPPAMDDSTAQAESQLQMLTEVYGGRDTWDPMHGLRYDVTYTIPGPEGVPVRSWTEMHFVWTKGTPKMRIDNMADSTIVLIDGDTTWVRRDGVWTSDSTSVAGDRANALEARWLARIPYSLLGERPKRRVEQAVGRDTAMIVRAESGAGENRPAGTIARVTFAPPTFGLSRVHWYDPAARAWFLMELTDERTRFGWRWAENRTVRTSDAAGTPGAIVMTVRVEDVLPAPELPDDLLHPPGRPR